MNCSITKTKFPKAGIITCPLLLLDKILCWRFPHLYGERTNLRTVADIPGCMECLAHKQKISLIRYILQAVHADLVLFCRIRYLGSITLDQNVHK